MKRMLTTLTAFILCLTLLTGCISRAEEGLLAAPVIPDMAQYPQENTDDIWFDDDAYDAWREDVSARAAITGYEDALTPFLTATVPAILGGSEGKNLVYSPLSMYTALAMLAETAGGETRAEALALLGSEDMVSLRQTVSDLWNANYRDDGTMTRTLAASLWLNASVPFQQETVDALAEYHHAASYRVEMGTEKANAALRKWLNDNTLNLLTEQSAAISLPSDTVAAIATTVAFSARWAGEFYEGNNTEDVFHAPDGDVNVTYMRADRRDTLYWGERFQAIRLSFDMDGAMWIILPDEGVTPEALLNDADALALLTGQGCENARNLLIHMSIPKFDVTSQVELSQQLKSLGVRSAFDMETADFTPLTSEDLDVYLSRVQHDARVVIDEEGCKAAAYTVMMLAAGAAPPQQIEEIDFVVDRPFLFVITGAGELPLFVGVVNNP